MFISRTLLVSAHLEPGTLKLKVLGETFRRMSLPAAEIEVTRRLTGFGAKTLVVYGEGRPFLFPAWIWKDWPSLVSAITSASEDARTPSP